MYMYYCYIQLLHHILRFSLVFHLHSMVTEQLQFDNLCYSIDTNSHIKAYMYFRYYYHHRKLLRFMSLVYYLHNSVLFLLHMILSFVLTLYMSILVYESLYYMLHFHLRYFNFHKVMGYCYLSLLMYHQYNILSYLQTHIQPLSMYILMSVRVVYIQLLHHILRFSLLFHLHSTG